MTQAVLAQFDRQPSAHWVEQIDKDRVRWREIAGPFFDAGGESFALTERAPGGTRVERKRHSHSFFIVLHGELEFDLGHRLIAIRADDLLFLPAGKTFQMRRKTHALWIDLSLADNHVWRPLKQHGHYVRKYESTALVYLLVSSVVKALRSQDIHSVRCAYENSELLVTILRRELDRTSRESAGAIPEKISHLLAQIQEHPEYQWDLPNMCRRIAMSQRALCRAFRADFDIPPGQMVRRIRMTRAASLLITTDRKITEIANAVGYESLYSFSRLFKKSYGVSPKGFQSLPPQARQALLAHARPGLQTTRSSLSAPKDQDW